MSTEKHNDLMFESAKDLLNELKSASESTRTTLSYLLILSLLICAGLFNTYLSWMENLNFKDRPSFIYEKHLSPNYILYEKLSDEIKNKNKDITEKALKDSLDSRILNLYLKSKIESNNLQYSNKEYKLIDYDLVTQIYINEFINRTRFTIPLLGINTNTADLIIVGTFCVLILIFWLYYKIMRENSILNNVLKIIHRIYLSNIASSLKFERISYLTDKAISTFLIITNKEVKNYNRLESRKLVKIQMQINKLNILGKFIFSIPILTITVLLIGDIFTSYKNHVLLEFITQQKWRILLSFFLYSFAVYFTYLIYKIARNTKDLQLELFKLVSATEESPIDLNLKTSDYENALSFYDEYHLGAQKIGPLLKGMTLEIGAGTGLFTQLVLKENTQIDKLICIDPNRENILECIKKNLQYNTKKQKPYYVTLGYDNFLSSGLKFDTIYSSLVWHHIPESNKYDFVAQQFDSIGINGKVFIFDVFTSDDPNKVVDEKGALIEFHNKRINGIINSNDENANYFFNENVDYNRLRDFALSMELKAFTDGLNEIGEYKISFYKANTIINKLKLKYKFQMSVECLNQITEEKIFRGYILLKFSGISVIDAMVSSK